MTKKIPEIRFKGFDEEWEEKKLEDMVNRISNISNDKNFPRIEYEDIKSSYGYLINDIYKKDNRNKPGTKFNEDDILFGKLRPYLKNYYHPKFKGIAVGDFWVLRANSTSPTFIYTFIQSDKFSFKANLSTGTKMPRSDWKLVSNSIFLIPEEVKEQEKIGSLFEKIDSLIEGQERAVDSYKGLKKSLLQKMFPKEGEKIPQLRFPGFDGEWKKVKLGDFLKESIEKSTINNQYDILSSTSKGIFLQKDYFNNQVASKDNTGYKILRLNQIVFSPQNLWLGNINLNDKYDIGIVSPSYKIFEIDFDNYNKNFVGELLKTKRMLYQYKISSEQGASVVRRNLNIDNFLNIKLLIPSLPEQKKIGDLFKKLDGLIEDEEKYLEDLKVLKKSLLQKMFV